MPPSRPRKTETPPSTHAPDAPAGGMGALASTLHHLRHEKSLVQGTKALRMLNQTDGFDCPGCAWPEPRERSFAEFCENGAKAVAHEATGKRAGPELFARHTVADMLSRTDYWLEQQGRLTHPMIRRAGAEHFEPLRWDEAFARAGQALRSLDHADQAAFYTSGRTSNEAAFLYQLFGRMLGTNNFPDCSNLCHESSGTGLKRTIGVGKGSVQLDDFEKAEAIFVIGQNPGTNHPRMLSALQAARRRGAKIVSINPLRERGLESFVHPQEIRATLTGTGSPISNVYLQPKVGSDVAVLQGIMKHVLEAERTSPGRVLDHGFLRMHTDGFDDLSAALNATPWARIEEETGLSQAQIREASDVYVNSRATIVCWAMGLTQHENAVDNVIACANLLLLKGNVGRPGAGVCPVRGHSNVQGDRTVGIDHAPPAAFLDALGAEFGFEAPRGRGLDVVEAIHAMNAGRIRFFMSMGGNFLSASPDTDLVAAGLAKVETAVFVLTKLNRSALAAGRETMIWPCLGRTETDVQAGGPQFVTVEDSMSVVHSSRGSNRPASPHLKSEPAIVAGLAKAALGPESTVDWDALVADYDRIRERIARVLPAFGDYNAQVRQPGGFVLRHAAAHREWNTGTGKARLIPVPTPHIRLGEGQLRLFTIRSHDQYNTTIYGMDDRYRGIEGARRVVLMHRDDLAERGLVPGQEVDIHSHAADGVPRMAPRFRTVEYDVPRGCAAAYFPEANVLVPIGSTARESNQPASKMVPVTVVPATSAVRVTGDDERLVPVSVDAEPSGAVHLAAAG
ncbi:MAG TPA: FdhF/YdeP family oxidoreductase [Longimicrobiaceae bacterium]|jgi:molybdopterin-dependent oxidoreductase alpha subunit|nr:FdhF/YdeP family oxidoreductase [Longimicrobiaceae bacterium]